MLQFEKVKKYYSSFLALDIPDLKISKGLWWLQGENGSGKTTFLKLLAGLHPFNGDIIADETYSIKRQRLHFIKRINYAEAEPLYPSFLTGKDLVSLYCETKQGSVDEAVDALCSLNVIDAYKKPVGTYSSGMVKKLSLVLAFIGKPMVILLDEPLITIDVSAVQEVCSMINQKRSEGVSFIITSHQTVPNEQLAFSGTMLAAHHTITSLNNENRH